MKKVEETSPRAHWRKWCELNTWAFMMPSVSDVGRCDFLAILKVSNLLHLSSSTDAERSTKNIRVPINHMGIGPNLVYHISISSCVSWVNSYTGYFSVNSASSSVTMSPFPTQHRRIREVVERGFQERRIQELFTDAYKGLVSWESWGIWSKEDCRLIVDGHQSIFIGVVLYI